MVSILTKSLSMLHSTMLSRFVLRVSEKFIPPEISRDLIIRMSLFHKKNTVGSDSIAIL